MTGTPSPSTNGNGKSLSAYYNASRMRMDTWDQLKHASQTLAETSADSPKHQQTKRRIGSALELLRPIEAYWAFPGRDKYADLMELFEQGSFAELAQRIRRIVRRMISDDYRRRDVETISQEDYEEEAAPGTAERPRTSGVSESRPYFEVLVVDAISAREQREVRRRLLGMRRNEDEFVYDVVFVPSFEDALIAVLFNYNIQSVIVRYSFPLHSENNLEILQRYIDTVDRSTAEESSEQDRSLILGSMIRRLRPELDLFLVTDAPVEDIAGKISSDFRRVFYRQEDYLELHLSVLKGISERYETPFFTALRNYSRKPTGVFHAMPISRAKSIVKSHWIQDMERFYGSNIFMAETSATSGGLDSLLQPHGSLKRAQKLAARAFGAKRTFFVTNGTSTANKIVMQALIQPGNIVLVSRDCHKSHHYAVILSGAQALYMDPYPNSEYTMYGAVPLREIKRTLLDLKKAGQLDRVKMLLLTNCTFDGVTYNPLRVMEEVLAIKPDIIFVWDEAWFAFGQFTPTTRGRMAMESARRLRERFRSENYAQAYAEWKERFGDPPNDSPRWLDEPLMADPARARVRVYATQSTHKSLTSLRQGSMIHIFDQDFDTQVVEPFTEAYMTHTSTSPNYQILASLDVGRRQVELEGYEFVQKSVELAMMLRERVREHALLRKYFRILGPKELIPAQYRPSQLEYYYDRKTGWTRMEEAWQTDEFALDPTRVTLYVGLTGMNGDTFRSYLMDNYDIQINKTSRNTVLFLIHIGSSRGSVAYLIETLTNIALALEESTEERNEVEAIIHSESVSSLTETVPPLPDFSAFHPAFLDDERMPALGDMRGAFFAAYDQTKCEYMRMDGTIEAALRGGRRVVSAGFVTPYPPGFPVLVPGQEISMEILLFLRALDVTEIHGYKPRYGLKVFKESALAELLRERRLRNPNHHDVRSLPNGTEADQQASLAAEKESGAESRSVQGRSH